MSAPDPVNDAIDVALANQRRAIVANLQAAADQYAGMESDPHFVAGLRHAAELVRR